MKIKQDFIPIIIIVFLFILSFLCSIGHISSVHSDIGREFYIPWRMNEGDILYKDIFNVYAPLGYQLNAIFLKLLGEGFFSLYIVGFVLSLISLICIYLITKEYSDKLYAFLTSILILFSCILYQSNCNWIAPYSYSLLYAITAFFLSFLMLLFYLKKKNIIYFILSCFFIGISVASKYEYTLFILILIFWAINKKLNLKYLFISALVILLPTLLSLSILFMQGCSYNDFIESVKYITALSHSESVIYFYKFIGIIPSYDWFIREIFQAFSKNTATLFSSIGFFAILIALFSIIKKDRMMIFLCMSMILASTKSFFSINLSIYSSFTLPMLLIVITAFIYRYKEKKIINILFCITMICLITVYSYTDMSEVIKNKRNKIKTEKKEILYANNRYFAQRYSELIPFIKEKTKTTDRILVFPEGVILNFITKRKSHNKYYYLIPPNIDIFSEDKIIQDLKYDSPEYIIIFSNRYYWFNRISFSDDFGRKITNFVKDNYTILENISGEFDKVYKLNEKHD